MEPLLFSKFQKYLIKIIISLYSVATVHTFSGRGLRALRPSIKYVTLEGMGGPWRRIWGDQKIFSRPNFRKNFHFHGKNFDLVLRIFPFFSHIFHMFTMLNVVYDHFLTRKTQFFTLFMLSRTSDNTTSQNIGGTNAWAVPPPQILGDHPPSPP